MHSHCPHRSGFRVDRPRTFSIGIVSGPTTGTSIFRTRSEARYGRRGRRRGAHARLARRPDRCLSRSRGQMPVVNQPLPAFPGQKRECRSRKSEPSAAMAFAKSFRAPRRKTSICGPQLHLARALGSANLTALSWAMAYLPFNGVSSFHGKWRLEHRRPASIHRRQLLPIARHSAS